jgi:hypothetical protein
MAYMKKEISVKNKGIRASYGQEHRDKTIDSFWPYIFFTNEAHTDPSERAQGYIL